MRTKNLRRDGARLSQQRDEEVLSSDVFVAKALGFFSGKCQRALAFVAERQVDRS